MKEGREEQEELLFGQVVAKTHPLADAERHEVFRLLDGFPVLGEEPLGLEGLGLLPVVRVHVDRVKKWNDVSVLWNDVALEIDRPEETKEMF